MASIEFAKEDASECSLLLFLLIDLSSEGVIGNGEYPSSDSSSSIESPLPLRAANFKAFINIGDSGVMLLSSLLRLGVVMSPLPPRSRFDILLDRDFALGLGVWGGAAWDDDILIANPYQLAGIIVNVVEVLI